MPNPEKKTCKDVRVNDEEDYSCHIAGEGCFIMQVYYNVQICFVYLYIVVKPLIKAATFNVGC